MKKKVYITPAVEVYPLCSSGMLAMSSVNIGNEEGSENLSVEKEENSPWGNSPWEENMFE